MRPMIFRPVITLILLLLAVVYVNAQSRIKKTPIAQTFTVTAKVDKRIELLSIVARLAAYEEYVHDDVKAYAEDVDRYFAKFKDHAVIREAVRLRESNSIGFDAVAAMAVHLTPELTPKVPFSNTVPDKRWGKENAIQFAALLKKFYKDADCETFFRSHEGLYKTAEERFQILLNKVDFSWYKRFYGELPSGTFNLYIGLLNGGGNFGPRVVYPNKSEELFAIIGTWQVDDKGLPIFGDGSLPIIIHEFNHSFINHLVYAAEKNFDASGEKIFPAIAEKMKRLAYGNWTTTVNESLVRAAVLRYQFDHGEQEKAYSGIMTERSNGFLWMDELFALFGAYENNRKMYPTFRAFIPTVAGYYLDAGTRIDREVATFAAMSPKVASIDEFANGATDVDPKIKQITVAFDRPLAGKGYSINLGSLGQDHFGITKAGGYSPDNMKITLEVALKPDWEYQFVLTGLSFKSRDGYPLQNYVVKFKTRKE